MTRTGKQAGKRQISAREEPSGDRDFVGRGTSIGKQKEQARTKAVLSEEAKQMRPENHPWLHFLKAKSVTKKIEFTNRLALLQDKAVFETRGMNFHMFRTLDVEVEVNRLLTTTTDVKRGNGVTEVAYPLWHTIFNNKEESRREWCLEFFSTITMDDIPDPSEFFTKKVIHFHCGGKPRDLTVGEFGYYTGMYSRELFEDVGFRNLLKLGKDSRTTGFPSETGDPRDYFTEISVEEEWSVKSKAALLKSPILRILHKMIVHLFLHRSTQWDKIYLVDLWLLRLFETGALRRYACTPIILAKYMVEHKDKQLVCGHFITTMVRRFGCYDDEENVHCSAGVPVKIFTWNDLYRWGVLLPAWEGHPRELIPYCNVGGGAPEGEGDQDMSYAREAGQSEPVRRRVRHTTPISPALDLSSLTASLNTIQGAKQNFQEQFTSFRDQYNNDTRYLGSQVGFLSYHMHRYQPQLESSFRDYSNPNPVPQYAPPEIFIPMHRQGGFWYPPPPPDLGETANPLSFGTYTGDQGASGSGSGGQHGEDIGRSFVDDIFGPPPQTGGGGPPPYYGDF